VVVDGLSVSKAAVDLSGYTGPMMAEGDSEWKTEKEYGFGVAPPPPVPTPPVPPAPPAPPPAPAETPAQPAAAPVGDADGKKARLDELRARMTAKPDDLSDDEMQELVTLTQALS
jgi:hypothetical protein